MDFVASQRHLCSASSKQACGLVTENVAPQPRANFRQTLVYSGIQHYWPSRNVSTFSSHATEEEWVTLRTLVLVVFGSTSNVVSAVPHFPWVQARTIGAF